MGWDVRSSGKTQEEGGGACDGGYSTIVQNRLNDLMRGKVNWGLVQDVDGGPGQVEFTSGPVQPWGKLEGTKAIVEVVVDIWVVV